MATAPAKKVATKTVAPAKKIEPTEKKPELKKVEAVEPVKEVSNKTDFKIESNIPIPPRSGGRGGRSGSKYPIRELQVNDSVFIEGKPTKVASAIQAAKKANPKHLFTSRVVIEGEVEGVRVWRTA